MLSDEDAVQVLGTDDCWALLTQHRFGRIAYRLVDEVHLVPINYVVDDGRLLFRTTAGNKLLAAALESEVAFEIDWHDETIAWSVQVRGRLRRLEEDEAHRADQLPLYPWIRGRDREVVEVRPATVTGRRFVLRGPEDREPASAG